MLTTVLLLCSAQLVEVPLDVFKSIAEPNVISAIALSPDAHTVSVWTRRSEQTLCIRWAVDVQTGATEGFGEDSCPVPALPADLRCSDKGCRLGKVALPGTRAQLTVHPVEPVLAFNSEQAVTFVSRANGRVLTSFGHAGWSLKGVAASHGEWLLWVQSRERVDELFLADGAELIANAAERPAVRPVMRVQLPDSFGWKKDSTGTPGSPCDFFERGVMINDDVLMVDWSAKSQPLEVRVRSREGQLQKWQVDVASATPVPGLQVERMHLAKQARWRLKITFPFPLEALALSPGGIKVPRLRPIVSAMSTPFAAPTCVFEDGELRPARFMLDPLLR